MPSTSSQDKLVGCLLGQCLGDALGFPVEGSGEVVCSKYVRDFVRPWFADVEPADDEWTGQYTDDSQLARELLESLIENAGWNPPDYARRIAEIFGSDRIVGRGLACDQAAHNLIGGADWRLSGVPAPKAGNGTAMRSAPVGMVYCDDADEMIRVAGEQGWITHHDPRCTAGSVAIAGVVALTLKGSLKDTDTMIKQLSEWTIPINRQFGEMILELKRWVPLSPEKALAEIALAGKPPHYQEFWAGISPFVIPSVLWSLYSSLRSPDNYLEAISTAISVGGDVDTTAAMTGAICGAHVGLDNLPKHLLSRLNDQGEWGFAELMTLANRL